MTSCNALYMNRPTIVILESGEEPYIHPTGDPACQCDNLCGRLHCIPVQVHHEAVRGTAVHSQLFTR